ncbi:helix-turn-helix transcriptional regulator [Nonomuraea sp. NPDC050404]|uniref:helix-turn-helix domain-containing protein n=1 Tax=Nonomuraea sp. NPDC050404 TaxID=3155783 RepID=UPI003408F96E
MQEFSGDKLRHYIKVRDFSVSEFAEAITRHPGAVYGYMEGHRNPSLEIVTVMADRLGVSVGDLFTDTELESAVSEFCRDIIRAGLDSLAAPGGREEGLLIDEDGWAPADLLSCRVQNAPHRSEGKVVRAAVERLEELDPELGEWARERLGFRKDVA